MVSLKGAQLKGAAKGAIKAIVVNIPIPRIQKCNFHKVLFSLLLAFHFIV
jgi:hypothetical protein